MPPSRLKIDLPFENDADLAEMVRQFEDCTWPYERWTHRAHLGVAISFLRWLPFDEALERARSGIQAYNRTCGDPNGYHETITVLFLRRVASFLRECKHSNAAAVEQMARSFDMRWPLRYYTAELLWSDEAKRCWVEPDLHPRDFEDAT
jgi:hypothetical protein